VPCPRARSRTPASIPEGVVHLCKHNPQLAGSRHMEVAVVARQMTCSAVGRAERSGWLAMLYKYQRWLDLKGVAAGIGNGGEGSSGGKGVET